MWFHKRQTEQERIQSLRKSNIELASKEYDQGNYSNCIKWINNCIRVSGEHHLPYAIRGAAYYSLNDHTTAVKDFLKSFFLNPEWEENKLAPRALINYKYDKLDVSKLSDTELNVFMGFQSQIRKNPWINETHKNTIESNCSKFPWIYNGGLFCQREVSINDTISLLEDTGHKRVTVKGDNQLIYFENEMMVNNHEYDYEVLAYNGFIVIKGEKVSCSRTIYCNSGKHNLSAMVSMYSMFTRDSCSNREKVIPLTIEEILYSPSFKDRCLVLNGRYQVSFIREDYDTDPQFRMEIRKNYS